MKPIVDRIISSIFKQLCYGQEIKGPNDKGPVGKLEIQVSFRVNVDIFSGKSSSYIVSCVDLFKSFVLRFCTTITAVITAAEVSVFLISLESLSKVLGFLIFIVSIIYRSLVSFTAFSDAIFMCLIPN